MAAKRKSPAKKSSRAAAPAAHRRAIPAQQRSLETVDKILRASEEILVERGLQGFNTNLVAEVAGVNVGTVYHYFPDKNSILRELFQRAEEVRLSYFAGRMAELQTTHDVRGWVEDVVRGILRLRRTNPSTAVLRRSIRVIPELMELENSTTAADVQVLSKAIRHRYSHVSAARAKSVAEVIIVMSAAILDRVDDATFTAATAAREVTVVVSSYLGSLDT